MIPEARALEPHATLAPPTDWKRVGRALFRVRQEYRYAYTGPVTDMRQRLIMIPPDTHGDQTLRAHTLGVDGALDPVMRWDVDRFGNRVCHLTAREVASAVEFLAVFEVERRVDEPPLRLRAGTLLEPFLAATALTAPNDALRSAASEIARRAERAAVIDELHELDAVARRQWALARAAGEWSAGAISYQHGITGVQTPAAMALHLGRGVCQDYAHIALAVLRLLGVPARYVSGHLLGEGAPHAWVEMLLPDPTAAGRLRAVAYDPTHRAAPGLSYMTVAVGRDYADVAPTSGSFTGTASGRLAAHKDAWILNLVPREEAA